MVDANYKFVAVDVGSYRREGDSGIFLKSDLGKKVLNGTFGFPDGNALPGSDTVLPYVIIGDEAFRLDTHIMKPYTRKSAKDDASKAVFNYRLSRARRVTENAFGLLSQVFRVFYQTININPETCDSMILVACCLHNMLREGYLEKNGKVFYNYDSEESRTINNMISIVREGGFNADGFHVRDAFKQFFMNEGAVSFQ
ncbi:protein ANTAGONIST OF LIKE HETEROCHROMATIN PROTEIN 1-like [Aphis craccivora]|uniref:Protein ANTAGONIST OF LIKE HETEROCHROMATIN PROTEIN 1-like n=1 Tax=Aphis craccivora TaxID=307492 RepID=A0A6G0Z1Q4_APHCR|nr:protein ANTAGONIST OF LIKE HETEROCHROMATIN PROTEIN 1-like [Aphis craccivora]